MKNIHEKSIILDFDHTIGYFKQFIFLINIIETIYKRKCTVDEYFLLINKYPYIFRPKIYDLIQFILSKNDSYKFLILYTCNNNKKFVYLIIDYIKYRLGENKIFNYEVFQNDGKNEKNINFLEKEINDYGKTSYFYIDDKKYNEMKRKDIKFIHCEKYIYNYPIYEILENFPFLNFNKITQKILNKYLKKYEEKCKKISLPIDTYTISTIRLVGLINEFLSN